MKNQIIAVFFGMLVQTVIAQELNVGVELRPRYEFRNGFKTLSDHAQDPASFVSQRSRLDFAFSYDNLKLVVRVQDIRIWGDVATDQSHSHNGLAVFEGYAQYNLDSVWSFKVGRQVLSYDNERILGEVNWAQQGRSHDAFMVSVTPNSKHRLEVGGSVSSNAETLTQTAYLINNYKNMQLVWYQYRLGTSKLSALFLNSGFEFERQEQNPKTQYMQTFGTFYNLNTGKWNVELSAYAQTGKRNDAEVSAWNGSASFHYLPTDNWQIGIGGEYLSGSSDMDGANSKNKSFNPLFGTNHKFNGFMDYFYVGNHANSVGLVDVYANFKFSKNKWNFEVSPHFFSSAAAVFNGKQKMDDYLGTEIDFVATCKLQKYISANLGYSQMFGSNSMEVLKGGNANKTQNWVWAMVTVKPEMFKL